MRARACLGVALALLWAGQGAAFAPERSGRPVPRSPAASQQVVEPVVIVTAATPGQDRPRPRPGATLDPFLAVPTDVEPIVVRFSTVNRPLPRPVPAGLGIAATATPLQVAAAHQQAAGATAGPGPSPAPVGGRGSVSPVVLPVPLGGAGEDPQSVPDAALPLVAALPQQEQAGADGPPPLATTEPVFTSTRPAPRPAGWPPARVARPTPVALPPPLSDGRQPQTLCQTPGLVGFPTAPIPGRLAGCGVANPVRVTSVSGVTLSTPATLNCRTARTLNSWVADGLIGSVGRYGGGVRELKVAAHYSCRTRNNQPGTKVSEHGKGNAIDISAIRLNNGDDMSVLDDWGKGRKGRILRQIHASACGPFGTVLGPNSDRFHQDHFHFDTARYTTRPYCR